MSDIKVLFENEPTAIPQIATLAGEAALICGRLHTMFRGIAADALVAGGDARANGAKISHYDQETTKLRDVVKELVHQQLRRGLVLRPPQLDIERAMFAETVPEVRQRRGPPKVRQPQRKAA
jgi:hypothetical protein